MATKRILYANLSTAVAPNGSTTYAKVNGIQSTGLSTRFQLEQVFQQGQLAIYDNIEGIPDVEVTIERVLDGSCPLFLRATQGSPAATLVGRSNAKCAIGVSTYSDLNSSASGVVVSQAVMSGLFVSTLGYSFPVQGNATESVTLVGNNRTNLLSFTAPTFNNADSPMAGSASGYTQQRWDFLFGPTDSTVVSKSLLPTEIPGITASGTNELDGEGNYAVHVQSIRVNTSLGRESMFEQGRKGAYHRYVNFPVEVTTEIEVMATQLDTIEALEDADPNTTNQRIYLMTKEGLHLDLGSSNRVQSVSFSGANAGANGGNATNTYSYRNYNDLTVLHPQDVTTALRP